MVEQISPEGNNPHEFLDAKVDRIKVYFKAVVDLATAQKEAVEAWRYDVDPKKSVRRKDQELLRLEGVISQSMHSLNFVLETLGYQSEPLESPPEDPKK